MGADCALLVAASATRSPLLALREILHPAPKNEPQCSSESAEACRNCYENGETGVIAVHISQR